MKQVVQSVGGGPVRVADVPRPTIAATEVLVQTRFSVISAGTERAVTQLAQSNLLNKAKARPELVRAVLAKARTEGVTQTARAVRAKLAGEIPLGYSAAGIAVEVGESVSGIRPGQLVATGGASKAAHAEFQAVPGMLTVPVPDSVSEADAAFATVGSIALHGFRQAGVEAGSKVVVIGLGLIGQLTARLAAAAGCDVAGIDVAEFPLQRAAASGVLALREEGDATTAEVLAWTRGRGADAVILTAAGQSSDMIMRAAAVARDRATVVVVGDVGLGLSRPPFFAKELEIKFARSYGPGRYDRSYEEWAVDYPVGYVRWTEGRNLEAFLDLLAARRIEVADLVTHRYDIARATHAYDLLETQAEPYLAIELSYPREAAPEPPVILRRRRVDGSPGVGFIGAGGFAAGVLVPAFRAAGFTNLVSVASASGLSARRLGADGGFHRAVSGARAVIDDPEVSVVVIATPHDTHAELAMAALRAGKHVFCEKPLALTQDELDEVADAAAHSAGVLFLGFNRRWSSILRRCQSHLGEGSGPLVVNYRVSAGQLPAEHWYHDRRQGGRLIGEVCHFVDTCNALTAGSVQDSFVLGSGGAETLLNDDLVIGLRYTNGSLATITYATGGHASTAKERVEVLGRGRSVVLEDFRQLVVDGVVDVKQTQDKGHRAAVAAFHRAVTVGDQALPDVIGSMRVTLDLAAKLRSGTR